MAWTIPTARTTGELITASIWNTDLKDNLLLLKTSIANDGTLASTLGILTTPELKAYKETKTAPTIAAGVLVLDYSLGTHFGVALNANITTLTISNPPASGKAGLFTLVLTADGTPRTISWAASIKWPGGIAPTPTSTNAKADIFTFLTFDGGTIWWGFVSGQNL